MDPTSQSPDPIITAPPTRKRRPRGRPERAEQPLIDESREPQPDLGEVRGEDDADSQAASAPPVAYMNLTELKRRSAAELLSYAEELGIENASTLRKPDLIFATLKRLAESGVPIYGEGVLEILQDGFGFLRTPDVNYFAGPDDIYVSPSQIRRFGLRTGERSAPPWRASALPAAYLSFCWP